MAPRRPEVFVASEFFAREPQRRAWEAMRRDHAEYEELFGPPPEERAEPQLERAAEIIAEAPWFAESFAALRSEIDTKKRKSGYASGGRLARRPSNFDATDAGAAGVTRKCPRWTINHAPCLSAGQANVDVLNTYVWR